MEGWRVLGEGAPGGQGTAAAGGGRGRSASAACPGSPRPRARAGCELEQEEPRAGVSSRRGLEQGHQAGLLAGSRQQVDREMGSQVPPADWLPAGMDASSTYLLKIKLFGNPRKVRDNIGPYCFDKFESDTTNFEDFIGSIVNQCPPGYLEVPHIQYCDSVLNTFPEVKTNQELQLMFDKHSKTKVVEMFISYTDPIDTFQPITKWPTDDTPSPSQLKKTQPMQQQPENSTQTDEDTYLQNPLPENEHVGIDEEVMYLPNEPVGAVNAIVCASEQIQQDKFSFDDDEDEGDDEEEDEECEDGSDSEDDEEFIVEEEGVEEPDQTPIAEYDPDDPPMTVGSTYPNMAEFKLALSSHAIKNEFEFNTEKSTKFRLRAYCSRKAKDNCPWRIHASTMEDRCTVKVKKNPCGHKCSSTRRKSKVKNATKHWICAKVKDWLIQDATLRAKPLQLKLKERYKVNIHYKRVYMGKELALRQLYGDWDGSFNNLYRLKAEIEKSCPGSSVIIDHYIVNGKIRFRRMFFALKPCIEGFLSGCRPYLAIDSTFLTGKYKGQLASASASSMSFPPSLERATKKKKKETGNASSSGKSARSAADSNHPDPISNESSEQPPAAKKSKGKKQSKKQAGTKLQRKEVAKKATKKLVLPSDSPAMGTRSKKSDPGSPAMSTRNRRRLSI